MRCRHREVSLKLTAIGAITPTHAMRTVWTWVFRESQVNATRAKQIPERFEGGLPEQPEWTINGSPERVGLSLGALISTEEKIEINPVV
jgi:hypothetical protein